MTAVTLAIEFTIKWSYVLHYEVNTSQSKLLKIMKFAQHFCQIAGLFSAPPINFNTASTANYRRKMFVFVPFER